MVDQTVGSGTPSTGGDSDFGAGALGQEVADSVIVGLVTTGCRIFGEADLVKAAGIAEKFDEDIKLASVLALELRVGIVKTGFGISGLFKAVDHAFRVEGEQFAARAQEGDLVAAIERLQPVTEIVDTVFDR